MTFGRILRADACFDAAVGVRVRTCSARRPPGRFSPFPPPALCSSLYAAGRMSTWSCQTWTRAQERARGRKESAIFWCDFAQWHGEAARRCELLYIWVAKARPVWPYYPNIFPLPPDYIANGLLPSAAASTQFCFVAFRSFVCPDRFFMVPISDCMT